MFSPSAVTFPETPRSLSAGENTLPAAAAAPAESRLLADAGGGVFGVMTSALGSAAASGAQTRNLGGASVFGQARRRPDCPDCHPSVYRYCSDLLLHDACCCLRDSQCEYYMETHVKSPPPTKKNHQ